jgi:hypothetical protein
MAAAASAHYNLRNFDEAQELFEDLLERDPHRIEVGPSMHFHTRHLPSFPLERVCLDCSVRFYHPRAVFE